MMRFRVFRPILGGEYHSEYHLRTFPLSPPQSTSVNSWYSPSSASRIWVSVTLA